MTLDPRPEAEVLERLVAWGRAEPSVRALVLTSSRARDDGSADVLSDYDVVVVVPDPGAFVEDDAWVSAFGAPIVRWGDESAHDGETTYFRGVVYAGGVRIDYTVWSLAFAERIAQRAALPDDLDVGYRVLLDEGAGTERWPPPTYRAHIPTPPSEARYRELVEEFWWDTLYVAKSLWRGDLLMAKFALDFDAKLVALRQLLEWRIELDHDWSLRPGVFGRGLQHHVAADVWTALAGTYVGPDPDENWEALFRTASLFRRVAREVADALGLCYPQEVDDAVSAQLQAIRELPHG